MDRATWEKTIESRPDDQTTRLVYADWLEQNDQPEEADRQRKYLASERWLKNFADIVDADFEEMMDVAESHCLDDEGDRKKVWPDYLIDGGKWDGEQTPEKFWVHYHIVTGRNPDTEYGLPGIFSCSC